MEFIQSILKPIWLEAKAYVLDPVNRRALIVGFIVGAVLL